MGLEIFCRLNEKSKYDQTKNMGEAEQREERDPVGKYIMKWVK